MHTHYPDRGWNGEGHYAALYFTMLFITNRYSITISEIYVCLDAAMAEAVSELDNSFDLDCSHILLMQLRSVNRCLKTFHIRAVGLFHEF